jgi:sugar transferase EpsL
MGVSSGLQYSAVSQVTHTQQMNPSRSSYQRWGKRVFDLAAGVMSLPVVLPLFVMVALLVRLRLGAPVLFRQERLGVGGRSFFIRKFRSMTDAHDAEGNLLPDAKRLTTTGRCLRATSLDELPELINVLRGEMSFVGPRPLHSRYRDRYTPQQFRRHEVTPGMTGWAQVNGRNALSWEDKFNFDLWYVEHQSLWLDLKILTLTLLRLISRAGINQQGQATAEEFQGSLQNGA